MEDTKVTLYRVRDCGFYNDAEQHQFATLDETFSSLLNWTAQLGSVGESSTYAIDEDADILRAFCLDLRDLGRGCYLLVTWNELPMTKEGVQLLQMGSPIGAADISAVEVDALSLPGYPAFFCIDAQRRCVVNIRFDQRLNGSRQFQRFVNGYLTSASPWCVWDVNDNTKLIGYSASDSGKDPKIEYGVTSKFSTTIVRVDGQDDYIRSNCGDIRKIIRRTTISPIIELHKSFLNSALQLAGLPVNNRLKADINFQYQFKVRLSPDKLESVIAQHSNNVDDSWDDVGFTFAKDSRTVHWLSSAIARTNWRMDVFRDAGGMINIESLTTYLRSHLEEIVVSFNE